MATTSDGGERQILRGDDARALIDTQIRAHNDGLLAALSRFDPRDAVRTWHSSIRAIEEFINVPLFGIDGDAVVQRLLSLRLDESLLNNPALALRSLNEAIAGQFDQGTVERINQLVIQLAAIRSAFRSSGNQNSYSQITLDTVSDALSYLQSRRRHFVALLYLLPRACKGSQKLPLLDALNVLLPLVEHSCVTITSLHLKLVLADVVPEFALEVDTVGGRASHWLDTLDRGFLDPERASILMMNELRRDQITVPDMEAIDPKKIFSAEELRNSIKLLRATYDSFGLNDSDFATMSSIVTSLSRRCRDDYVVAISKPKLKALLSAAGGTRALEYERLLIQRPSNDYATSTNAFEPFIDLGDAVVSNVNLLLRFLYSFKNIHLGSRRRFQIHAGFIFEEAVANALRRMGFNVTEIKRLNRKEFDVVTTLGDTIHNFQCKNNFVDLAKVESDRAIFVRYNRTLNNYYARALEKEERRQTLLKDALGLSKVEHYVISRFPVISNDPRIICFNKIDDLSILIEQTPPQCT